MHVHFHDKIFTDLFIIRAYPRNPVFHPCQLTPRIQTGATQPIKIPPTRLQQAFRAGR